MHADAIAVQVHIVTRDVVVLSHREEEKGQVHGMDKVGHRAAGRRGEGEGGRRERGRGARGKHGAGIRQAHQLMSERSISEHRALVVAADTSSMPQCHVHQMVLSSLS